MDAMIRLNEYMSNRVIELKRMRDEGKKVVAYFIGDFVPTEIIYAAGAIPVGLVYGGDSDAVDASSYAVYRYLCPFARAQFGYWVMRDHVPYYNFIDLLTVPISCQHLRRAGDLYEYYTDIPVFKMGLPQAYDGERALKYFKDTLVLFKNRVEALTGNKIGNEDIRAAVKVYHRMRDLLRKISELRKLPRPPITTIDFIRLNHAAHLADPKFMIEILESLYEEVRGKEGLYENRPRILIAGPNIALGDLKVLNLIEELGGMTVVEDIAEGILFYWENVVCNRDPIAALAERYLMKRPNCSFRWPNLERHLDFIGTLARDFSVDGIIWYQLSLCETFIMESYFIKERFGQMDPPIPFLRIDSEYDIGDIGPLRTRIETFIQLLKKK
ncbi:MAG: 2-hydroxyacyl-CoA dehydratase [Deltaproteobacteria bacterium]|nr:2-hydroxyacyl-CoA dehydratase [Deltaproteobacteria bacterium]